MILTPKVKRKLGHILNIILATPVLLLLVLMGLSIYDSYEYHRQEERKERQEYWNNYF